MADLIDRKLIHIDYEPNFNGRKTLKVEEVKNFLNWFQDLIKRDIDKIPKADTERHAHWIDNGDTYECSNCGDKFYGIDTKYCSSCGCKMDEVVE